MSDEQIIVLYRGIGAVAIAWPQDRAAAINQEDLDIPDPTQPADRLWSNLTADVRDLAKRAPERVRSVVQRCLASPKAIDREFAAYIIPGLINHDYAFTRDTLLDLAYGYGEAPDYPHYADLPASAGDAIRFLMRDGLTPEQVADFQAHAATYDPGELPEPAPPGKQWD